MSFTKREIARFLGQLQMLLSAGVPLLSALQIIKNMTRRQFVDKVKESLSEGNSLGSSLQPYFPPLVISSLESAEQAGNQEEALERLSRYYEESAETEEKIKSALIYPAFVSALSLFSLLILFIFVLPGFKSLFADLDAELPLFSRIFIGAGESISRIWPLFFVGGLGGAAFLSRYRKSERGALATDKWLMGTKWFAREQIIHGFRVLGSLLKNGVSIREALDAVVRSSKNRYFSGLVSEVKNDIEEGESLSAAFSRHKLFPNEAVQMVSVGEGSGNLAEMLLSVAGFYEKEREVRLKRFTVMLEPILTLLVGAVVGLIVLAVFLPMMSVISKLQ